MKPRIYCVAGWWLCHIDGSIAGVGRYPVIAYHQWLHAMGAA